MLVRKTKKQKEYLLKLKKEVSDFIINYKKRYQLFPWNEVNKVSKLQINSNSPIKVNGIDFTVKKLVSEINKTKPKIQSKLKPYHYNYILKAYIKDSINKDNKLLEEVYNQYKEELQSVFKEVQLDLLFCLEGLKQLNKALKPEKKKIKKNTESKKVLTENAKDDNLELESLCKKIVNESYTFIRNFLSRPEIKNKYKKWYDNEDVDISDMEKDIDDYSIDCGITQDASTSSNIFNELLNELNKYLDEKYHDDIQKYKISWSEKNSGFIWLTIDSRSADKVLEE